MPDFSSVLNYISRNFSLAREIDLGFSDWGAFPVFMEYSVAVLKYAGILAGVYILFLLVRKLFLTPRGKDDKLDMEQTKEVLERALVERAKLEITLSRENIGGASVACELVSYGTDTIKLAVPDYYRAINEAMGRNIYCFFKLRNTETRKKWHIRNKPQAELKEGGDTHHKTEGESSAKSAAEVLNMLAARYGGKWIFYHFNAKLLSLKQENEKIATLEFPRDMRMRQRRRFFRIEPPASTFLELSVWTELVSERLYGQLGKPSYLLTEGRKSKSRMVDLSAGGMHIELEAMEIAKTSLPLASGGTWFMRLVLWEPSVKKTYQWWLLARIVLSVKDNTGKMNIGFKFIGIADQPEVGQKFQWRHVDEEKGVDMLGKWVFKRSLDNRIKGLE